MFYPLHRQVAENAGYCLPGLALRFSQADERRVVAGAIRLLLDPGGTRVGALPVPQIQRIDATVERILALTPRERQVMSLVAEGMSNKAIARQLAISPRTVEIHRARMMTKMGAVSVGALIRLVLASQHPGL